MNGRLHLLGFLTRPGHSGRYLIIILALGMHSGLQFASRGTRLGIRQCPEHLSRLGDLNSVQRFRVGTGNPWEPCFLLLG